MSQQNGTPQESSELDITPKVSREELDTLRSEIYGLKGGSLTQLHGYDDLNYYFCPTVSCNPFIKNLWPHGYTLKVMNSLDSENIGLCAAQNEMMLFLREHGISSPVPVKTMRGNYYEKEKLPIKVIDKSHQKYHIIRVLEFQEGTVLKKIPKSYPVFHKLGIFLGKLNEVLKKFWHPVYKKHRSIWHLTSASGIQYSLDVIESPKRRDLVKTIIGKYTETFLGNVETLEKGIIHGDFNEHNVLMREVGKEEWEVSAILDFGDSHYSYYLFELAIALCYMMMECKSQNLNPVLGAGHLLAGYLTIRPSMNMNYGLLKLCICARLCQSLVLGLNAFRTHPENTYVLDSQEHGWPLLEELWEISEEKLTEELESVFRFYDIKPQQKTE